MHKIDLTHTCPLLRSSWITKLLHRSTRSKQHSPLRPWTGLHQTRLRTWLKHTSLHHARLHQSRLKHTRRHPHARLHQTCNKFMFSVSNILSKCSNKKGKALETPVTKCFQQRGTPPLPPSGAVINHQWVMNYWTAFNEFWILLKHHLITWIQIRKSRRCLHHLPWLRHYGPLWIHHQLPCQGVWSANWPTSCNF